MMRNIILTDLDEFWDFLLKGEGRKWQICDFIKIGKICKNLIWHLAIWPPDSFIQKKTGYGFEKSGKTILENPKCFFDFTFLIFAD